MLMIKLASATLSIANTPSVPLESVYAARHDDVGLSVQVRPNGCTKASSFFVHLTRTEQGASIALERRTPDMCRGFFRKGEQVRWTWSELGIERPNILTLANPVVKQEV